MSDYVDIGDYRYTYASDEVTVEVLDRTKSSYGEIQSSVTINGNVYPVTRMAGCFSDCTSLTTSPIIPNGVTNLQCCFSGCTSLITPPVIPSSVIYMYRCFYNCTSLTIAPIIPSGVTEMEECFSLCTNLIGQIYVLSITLDSYSNCFKDTLEPIFIYFYTESVANLLINTANQHNVYKGGSITGVKIQEIFNIRRLTSSENATYGTSNAIRIDMILSGCGCITNVNLTALTLYDMDDNEMVLGMYGIDGMIMCYGILDNSNQVPSTNINIAITSTYVPEMTSTKSISRPCTATPVKIEQEGENSIISSQISNPTMVRFDARNTDGIDGMYTIQDVLNGLGIDYVNNPNNVNVQTIVDNDIKHFVTTASNIVGFGSDGTETLQEVINSLYESVS